jgi:hypothetical protein
MAKLICLLPGSPCFDPADPITNFSSDQEDRQRFVSRSRGSFGRVFGQSFANPEAAVRGANITFSLDEFPGTPGFDNPPLGSDWSSESCGGGCVSDVSQEEADICANNLGADCLAFDPPETINTDGPNTCILENGQTICFPTPPGQQPTSQIPRTIYRNSPQTCTTTCPDGAIFSYTTPAGTFKASSQAQANANAYTYACAKASKNSLCLSDLTVETACLTEQFSGAITATNRFGGAQFNPPITMGVVSGTIPPGMVVSQSPTQLFINGLPLAVGTYAFTVLAVSAIGAPMVKNYSIRVIGIANTSLAGGSVGAAYSDTLTSAGPVVGDVTWSIFAGSLPEGLSLNADTGVISGTIDAGETAGDFPITFRMCDEDEGGICCLRSLTIVVEDVVCPVTGAWTEIFSNVTGTCSGTDSYILCEMNGTVNGGTGEGAYSNWQTFDFTNTSGVPVTIRFGGTHDTTAVASPGPDFTLSNVRSDVYWTVISGAGSSGGPASPFVVAASNAGGPVDTDHQSGAVTVVDVVVPAGSHFLFELDIDAAVHGVNFNLPDGTVSSVFNLTVQQI